MNGLENTRPAAHADSFCETCHSLVDLTTSVLMKGHRIVGCAACNWLSSSARSAGGRTALASTPST